MGLQMLLTMLLLKKSSYSTEPECGEVLVAGDAAKVLSVRGETAGRMGPPASRYADGEPRLPLTAVDKLSAPPTGRENGTLVAALPRST